MKLKEFPGIQNIRNYKRLSAYNLLYQKYKDHTMVPKETFVQNLDLCNHYRNIEGDYVECGVWKGGMSASIAEVLGPERSIHLFDSFQGLPPAENIDGPDAIAWQKDTTSPNYHENCSASESFAIEAMDMANHEQYKVYSGWFDQTLTQFPDRPIAILRLDGDWYKSIMYCLQVLFPKVVNGGIVILDDYYTWDGCSRAVHDYLSTSKSSSRIYQWKDHVSFIHKKD